MVQRVTLYLAVTIVAILFGLTTIFVIQGDVVLTSVGVVSILVGVIGFLGAVGSSLGEEYDTDTA